MLDEADDLDLAARMFNVLPAVAIPVEDEDEDEEEDDDEVMVFRASNFDSSPSRRKVEFNSLCKRSNAVVNDSSSTFFAFSFSLTCFWLLALRIEYTPMRKVI